MIEETEVIKTDFYLKLANEASMATVLSAFYNETLDTSYGVTPDAPQRIWL